MTHYWTNALLKRIFLKVKQDFVLKIFWRKGAAVAWPESGFHETSCSVPVPERAAAYIAQFSVNAAALSLLYEIFKTVCEVVFNMDFLNINGLFNKK